MDEMQRKPPPSIPEIPLPDLAGSLGFQQTPARPEPRRGDPCPVCQVGKLAYDGLMNLACPVCDFVAVGCFTL
jgi:hypothetical protein